MHKTNQTNILISHLSKHPSCYFKLPVLDYWWLFFHSVAVLSLSWTFNIVLSKKWLTKGSKTIWPKHKFTQPKTILLKISQLDSYQFWLHFLYQLTEQVDKIWSWIEPRVIIQLPVSKHAARHMLLGTSEVREAPVIKLGTTVMRSMLFSCANFHAVLSASVLETG